MKKSVTAAASGIISAFKSERNMRFHVCAAFYVVVAAIVTHASAMEWSILLICIASVMCLELLNTALEKLCDEVHPDFSPRIGMVKDIAAGAVLICAVISAAVGLTIFMRAEKLEYARNFIDEHTGMAALIVMTLPGAVYLIIRRYKNDN